MLLSIPVEISNDIFLSLPIPDIGVLRLVCSELNRIIEDYTFKSLCYTQLNEGNLLLGQMDAEFTKQIGNFDWSEYFPHISLDQQSSAQFLKNKKFYILYRFLNDLVWDPQHTAHHMKITRGLLAVPSSSYAGGIAKRMLRHNATSTWWVELSPAKVWINIGIATREFRPQSNSENNDPDRNAYNQNHVYAVSCWGQIYCHQRNTRKRGERSIKEWSNWAPVVLRLDCDLKKGLLMITNFETPEHISSAILVMHSSFSTQNFYPYALFSGNNLSAHLKSTAHGYPEWIQKWQPEWNKTHLYDADQL